MQQKIKHFHKITMLELLIKVIDIDKTQIIKFKNLIEKYDYVKIIKCVTGYRKNINGVIFKIA